MVMRTVTALCLSALAIAGLQAPNAPQQPLKRAFVDGAGWRQLTLADFVVVNGTADTWTQRGDVIAGTGQPIGGARSKQAFTNFELVLEWQHLKRDVGQPGHLQ